MNIVELAGVREERTGPQKEETGFVRDKKNRGEKPEKIG